MEYGEPLMLTGAILVGLVVLTLVAQVFHAVKIQKTEDVINNKLDKIIELLSQDQHYDQSVNLEDLINRDLLETMAMPDLQLEKLLKDIKDYE